MSQLLNLASMLGLTLLVVCDCLITVCVCTGLKQPMPELIVHVDSMDLFPVSWCETNGYPLVFPIKPQGKNIIIIVDC